MRYTLYRVAAMIPFLIVLLYAAENHQYWADGILGAVTGACLILYGFVYSKLVTYELISRLNRELKKPENS